MGLPSSVVIPGTFKPSTPKKYLVNFEIFNVYTKTKYHLDSKRYNNLTKTRINEEINTFKKLHISPKFLNYNDATMREYLSENHYMSPKNVIKEDSSFDAVKTAVIDAGALGCAISGSGPSIFALSKGEATAKAVQIAMQNVYSTSDIQFETYVSKINITGIKTL